MKDREKGRGQSDRLIQDRDLEDKKVDDRDNDGRGQGIWRTVTWRKGT
jgi:hypothetical protein